MSSTISARELAAEKQSASYREDPNEVDRRHDVVFLCDTFTSNCYHVTRQALSGPVGVLMAYVLINGSFGVGKTSVANELHRLLPNSVVFDPEVIGFALRRLPGYRKSDYQHLKLWRRLAVLGAKFAALGKTAVIIPMAFSEPRYLEEIRTGLSSGDRPVFHYCLVAPLSVVRGRLAMRGEPEGDPRWSWVHRRASECCAAHESAAFAIHVPTTGIAIGAIAATLAREIQKRGHYD
jgi:hypothetical protein